MDYRFNVNVNEYLPLREVVFNNLRDAILNGQLHPGERLLENQLAEKLGGSRTPVREALIRLEREGVVDAVANAGYGTGEFGGAGAKKRGPGVGFKRR